MPRLVINVDNSNFTGDGEVIDLVDNAPFLGEGSVLDDRNLQKLEFLEVAIRNRRILLEKFKNTVSA